MKEIRKSHRCTVAHWYLSQHRRLDHHRRGRYWPVPLALALAAAISWTAGTCRAAPAGFDPHSILASSGGTIYEYTPAGSLVKELAVPDLGETVRDVVVHPSGDLLVFNGTFSPRLSTYDSVAGTWSHETHPDWGTANNVSYGGITTNGRYVYVPDNLSGDDGVVRFDRQVGATIRSAVKPDTFDITLGLDGLLYTLNGTGSPSGRSVSVFDPLTLDHLRDVNIGHVSSSNRGIAVDSDGSLFIATWSGQLFHLDSTGGVLDSLALPTAHPSLSSNHFDVDLRSDGAILVGQRWGTVVQTDRDFSSTSSFLVPTQRNVFVSFAQPVPEPAAPLLVTAALVGGSAIARRRRRRVTRGSA